MLSVLQNDRGYATVVGVGFISALICLAGVLGLGAQLLCDAVRAQVAADMSAIAGALAGMEGRDACLEASTIAEANHAYMTECSRDSEDVEVTVHVGSQTRRAKAGPLS